MIVMGLMSGTSADGTDAAIVRIQGDPSQLEWELITHLNIPHSSELREAILAGFAHPSLADICQLNVRLGYAFAETARQALKIAGPVDLIGSHGQTLWHHPNGSWPSTLQIGDPSVIAEVTGIPVISHFRQRDMAAGGQGAPLVAYVDQILFTHATRTRAAQNIGGIGNVTYLPPRNSSEPVFAFDTGPGNLLIDEAMSWISYGSKQYDQNGSLAAQGKVQEEFLLKWLQDPYLQQPPPKTTGREYFGRTKALAYLEDMAEFSDPDRVATLTALTAHSIAQAYRQFLPQFPKDVIVSGGGSCNPTLMQYLQTALQPALVIPSDRLGIPVQAKEALAFAILAYETWHNRPGNLPSATGAKHPVILGQLTPVQIPSPPQPSQGSTTETRNPNTTDIDTLPTLEMVERILSEDALVSQAVEAEKETIAAAIDAIANRMEQGGRLIYVGAGTSGRLGVLDAAECPPTFSTKPGQVIALIAGGSQAITQAVEGAEDNREAGSQEIKTLQISALDSVVGIAASGQTPYVLGAIIEACQHGSLTIGLTCNRPSPLETLVDLCIAPIVGPEVIMGSTRLKAGTAQKRVLNLLSTGVMIRLGKTFGNLMVDLQATNVKLHARSRRILELACGIPADLAQEHLHQCGGNLKVALVSTLATISPQEAAQHLNTQKGKVKAALNQILSKDLPQNPESDKLNKK